MIKPRLLSLALFSTFFLQSLPGMAQIRHVFDGLTRTRVQYLDARCEALDEAKGTVKISNHLICRRDDLSEGYLNELRQELVNLPAFSEANWELDTFSRPDGSLDTLVRWTLDEGRTIFPIVNFGGIKGNTFYQVGFNDIHFRGRGQELTAFYQNNAGEHNYLVLLRNQTIKGSRWGYSIESRRYAAVEPVYFPEGAVDYRYSNLSFGVGLSYNLPGHQLISIGLSPFQERYRKIKTGDSDTSPGPDLLNQNKFLTKFGYARNRIDTHMERVAGNHNETNLQAVRTANEASTFLIVWHDFRYYYLIGERSNLAARLRAGVSSNNETPFAPFVLDSQFNIRGSGNRIDRGTAQLVLNLEYRYSVWRDKKDRFAAQLVGFSDLGSWRSAGGELSDLLKNESLRQFVGGGIRLISLKAHNAVIRIDYGIDVRNKQERGLVAGFGQYF